MKLIIIICILAIGYGIYSGEISLDDDLETAKYNVHFISAKGKNIHLGVAQGVKACRNMVNNHAKRGEKTGWSFYCCRMTATSACVEKVK